MAIQKALTQSDKTFALNEPLDLGSYTLLIKNEHLSAEITGKLEFMTIPTPHVYFSGNANPNKKPMTLMAIEATVYEASCDGLNIGKIGLRHYNEQTLSVEGEIFGNVVLGDRSIAVNTVQFLIPNMADLFGDAIGYSNGTFSAGRHVFEDEKYIITMDKVFEFERLRLEWELKRGGFFFGYTCELRVKKGAASFKEIRNILSIFGVFLSFLNGRKTNPLIIKGINTEDNKALWSDYTRYENFQGLHNRIHEITLPHYNMNLEKIWVAFRKLFDDNNDKNFIQSAVNWYTEANCSRSVQSAIILSQTAMELIYNWLVVEKKQIISGEDAKNINASNKLRLVSAVVKFDVNFEKLQVLKTLSDENTGTAVKDIFEIIVEVRNSLVHSQRAKRMALEKLPEGTLWQSNAAFLYLIEVSLLFICDYEGRFSSRLISPTFSKIIAVPVPWHRYYDRIWKNINTGKSDPDLVKQEQKLNYPDDK